MTDAIRKRLEFLAATDALKHVRRANTTTDGSRQENAAEHSWHVSLMAMVFADCAPAGTNLSHVQELLLVHDLVEVFAGDTVIWDSVSEQEVQKREQAAATQLFAMLDAPLRDAFRAIWDEFEALETDEARFAKALDQLHPMLMSWGETSVGHPRPDLRPAMVLARKQRYLEAFPELWLIASNLIHSAVARGLLLPDQ